MIKGASIPTPSTTSESYVSSPESSDKGSDKIQKSNVEAMLKFLACAKLDLSLSDHCNQVKISCEINHSETQQWELNHSKIQQSEHKISIKVDGEEIDPSKLVISSIQNEKILLSFDDNTLIVIHGSALSNNCIQQPIESMPNAVLETEKLADQEISFLGAWKKGGLLTSNPKKGIIKVHDSEDGSEGEFTALLTPSAEALKNQGIKVVGDLSSLKIPLFHYNVSSMEFLSQPIANDFVGLCTFLKDPLNIVNVEEVIESGQIKVAFVIADTNTDVNPNDLKEASYYSVLRLFFYETTASLRDLVNNERAEYETLKELPQNHIKKVAEVYAKHVFRHFFLAMIFDYLQDNKDSLPHNYVFIDTSQFSFSDLKPEDVEMMLPCAPFLSAIQKEISKEFTECLNTTIQNLAPKTDITSSTCSDVAATEEHSVKRSMTI